MNDLLGKLRSLAQVTELSSGRSEHRVVLRQDDAMLQVLEQAPLRELVGLRRAGVRRVAGRFALPDHALTLALP